jgi:hypothetical protein
VIPADRIDANARALLNLFPMPNATDPTGTNQYNYVFLPRLQFAAAGRIAAESNGVSLPSPERSAGGAVSSR